MKQYESKNIRNVAFIGHGGSGKTSLGEAVLFDAGTTNRLASVLEQNSNFDFEPEEIKRGGSITTSMAAVEWKGKKVTVLDTPGDNNFFFDARNSLFVADVAALSISAVDGVQVMTEKMSETAEQLGIPRLIVINKMDRERANFQSTLDSAKELLSKRIAPVIIPIGAEGSFKGVVNVLKGRAYMSAGDGSRDVKEVDVPGDMAAEVAAAKEALIEVVAESDDTLMEKYLDTMELSEEEISTALPKAIAKGLLIPAVCASATKNVGIQALLDLICELFPSPLERAPLRAKNGDAESLIAPNPAGPLVGTVFKTIQDKFTGSLSMIRIWSGSLVAEAGFYNTIKSEKERIGQILLPMGKKQEGVPQATTGDIIAVAKLKATKTGDTLGEEKSRIVVEPLPALFPIISYALRAKDKNDEDKLGQALNRVAEEDPTLQITRDPESKETQISGMGQIHIETTVEKIRRKFDLEVELLPPKIPYRETIRRKVENIEGKHKKQSGGRGQFGVAYMHVEPLTRGGGFEYVDAIVGGSIPRQWIPSVEKGIVARMSRGVIAGYPLVDVKVTVYDGKYHDVDSSDMAFQMAGSKGFKVAVEKADAYLLEPIWNLEVTVPDEFMGDVMGDISSRRGRVQGMEAKGRYQVIRAQVPMAELLQYGPVLDSITGGRGSFIVGFSHYDELPREQSEKVIAAYQGEEEED
jgi:elongation factor G